MVNSVFILFCIICVGCISMSTYGWDVVPTDFHAPDSCQLNEYFDSVTLKCMQCPANESYIPLEDDYLLNNYPGKMQWHSKSSCHCNPGSVSVWSEGIVTCQECPNEHVASSDGRSCIKCQDDLYDPLSKTCKQCPEGYTSVDRLTNGTQLNFVSCIKCSNNTYADRTHNRCTSCHPSFYLDGEKCLCQKDSHIVVDGQCIKQSEFSEIPDRESSYIVDYDSTRIKSSFFHMFYRSAAHSCTFKVNHTACQILGNMCVLLHYKFDNELSVCAYYRAKFGTAMADVPDYVPWLYYNDKDANRILTDRRINSLYSFKETHPNHLLNFTVAKYSPQGKLVGYGNIAQIWDICHGLKSRLNYALKFGITFHSTCHMTVQSLWTDYETYFYEVFLNYIDTANNSVKMYPVPVLNRNYQLEKASVNRDRSRYKWQLTRRFFFFDNLSGKEHIDDGKSNLASVVRYVKSIQIQINKRQGDADGLIYPPLIILKYGEVTLESFASKSTVPVTMDIIYSMDFSHAKRAISIAVGVMSFFAILWSLIVTYSWGKRNSKVGIDLSGIVMFLLVVCGNLANVFFIVVFCTCLYWTLIFKRQDVAFLFLPTVNDEFLIKQYLISAFALKIVHLCYVMYGQMTFDLFLVDWEKPRAQNTIPHPHLSKTMDHKRGKTDQPISIWRIYFIANEWNEIQTLRKINLAYQLVALLFFLKVVGFENLATYDPNSNSAAIDFDSQSPHSFICRFSISMSVYLILIGVQLLFRTIVFERYIEYKLQQFIDLCSMANISVFILQYSLYGYYIHGRSVHGFADSDLQTFYEQLKREEEDLCAHRGLEASSECQTFEIIMTYKFREEYSRILTPTQFNIIPLTPQYASNKLRIDSLKVEQTVQAHETMKNFFEMFLQHSSSDVDYVVKDKFFLETILDVEFQDVEDKCIFFRDHNHLFDRVLFYGQETLLIMFEMLVFTFVDMLCYDYVLAAVVTYAVADLIRVIRNAGGKRNLIKKTLVDQRFLI